MRPSELLRDWPDRDRALALALTQMEDQTGPEGHAVVDEMDPDTEGWWEARVVTNQASAARQRFLASDEGKNLEPGAMVIIHRQNATTEE